MLMNRLGGSGSLVNQVGLFADDNGTTILLQFADVKILEYVRASGNILISGGFKAGKTLRS